jgi:hypothetical protein
MSQFIEFTVLFLAGLASLVVYDFYKGTIWDSIWPTSYAPVLVNGQPLRDGKACNQLGNYVTLDHYGRCAIPRNWHSGSRLSFFDHLGNLVGFAVLTLGPAGEWETLRPVPDPVQLPAIGKAPNAAPGLGT